MRPEHLEQCLYAYLPMLYVPATRQNLPSLLAKRGSRSPYTLTICLEDAVAPGDRIKATKSLARVLAETETSVTPLFVRPADDEILEMVLDTYPLEKISGIVLPKATVERINRWVEMTSSLTQIIPILESREALDPSGRANLSQVCDYHRGVVRCARIGGNDLLCLLGGLRRPRGWTIYETPVGRVIDALLEAFCVTGVTLCAPVFEYFTDPKTLRRELQEDVFRGLYSKTAIHPDQVGPIWKSYRPSVAELEDAKLLIDSDSPVIMRSNGSMLEKACHRRWAERIVKMEGLHESVTGGAS